MLILESFGVPKSTNEAVAPPLTDGPTQPPPNVEAPRIIAQAAVAVAVEPEREAAPAPAPPPAPAARETVGSGDRKGKPDNELRQTMAEASPSAEPTAAPQIPATGLRAGMTTTSFAEAPRPSAAAEPAPTQTMETRTPAQGPRQVTIELDGPASDPTRIRVAVFGSSVRATILGEAGQSERLVEHTGELRQALEDRGFRTASVSVRTIGEAPVNAGSTTTGGRSGSEPEQKPGSRRQDLPEHRQNPDTHDRPRHSRRPKPEEE